MEREAIILAGGLGTRLKSVVSDLPKSLAPINGKPFLEYLLNYIRYQGVQKFVFALGYKSELIEEFVHSFLEKGEYSFSFEDQPLGTGGAIYKACEQINADSALIFNADTFFGVNIPKLLQEHDVKNSDCTIALKPMMSFDRYGAVQINNEHQVIGFSEKKFQEKGLINGGVYVLNTKKFLNKIFPESFSFEKNYLEKEYSNGKIFGMISESYFIDIGIPEDYQRAQFEILLHMPK